MVVDLATLHDLDVLPLPTARGTTLWGVIDRTRSRAGRQALRDRLRDPPTTAADILKCQSAHQYLATHARAFGEALDLAAANDVESYLAVTWQLPDDMPAVKRARRWYRPYLRDVQRGRSVVGSLFASCTGLARQLASTDGPLLRSVGDAMARTLETKDMQQLRRLAASTRSASAIRFDQTARGQARTHVERLLHVVGAIDAMWSLGVTTAERGWSYPRPSTRLRTTGLVHPFLGKNAVANDLVLDDQVRACFLTGPNMAGKSTFLKAVALSVLLAHVGAGVPAASMEFVPVGALFSSVQIADNLAAGESFYLAEVRRIGALAEALAEHGSIVAVIDEPFRGTNVHDAAEATIAILTRLAAHPSALVFVASHVAEVVRAIGDDPRIALLQFSAAVSDGQPTFDYRLREGVSEQRLGMALLRREGVLDRLEHPRRPATIIEPA